MSMPYHKELLRSSVSLRFREFFVFRNKVKGVMTLLCQFEKMIYPSGTGAVDAASFMIALYRPCEKLKDSSGNTITQIKAVGYCLPTASNMRYEMRGHWRKDPKYGIQYDVEGYEEQIIPTREGIVAYIQATRTARNAILPRQQPLADTWQINLPFRPANGHRRQPLVLHCVTPASVCSLLWQVMNLKILPRMN